MVDRVIIRPGQEEALAAETTRLDLPHGLYVFAVEGAAPLAHGARTALPLPAVHLALAPDTAGKATILRGGAEDRGPWLFDGSDLIVVRVVAPEARLLITSIPAPGGAALTFGVRRIDGSHGERIALSGAAAAASSAARPLRLEMRLRVAGRGEMSFVDVPWFGKLGPGASLEAFAIKPLEELDATDIEYKGFAASGFETAWIGKGKMCGARDAADPLIGFKVRLGRRAAAVYDCRYGGYFRSGRMIGPLGAGALCRSSDPGDPLEALQLQIVRRGG